jgi:hypothetical protein
MINGNSTKHLLTTLLACTVSLGWMESSSIAHAAGIDTDNNGSRFVWSENVGWLNFLSSNGDPSVAVDVTDDHLSGMVWGENIGWVALNCNTNCTDAFFQVTNDGLGQLAGYAWGENVGWLSFSCRNTASCDRVNYGVNIDPITGVFSGHAWGENIGWVVFNSSPNSPALLTAWRARDVDGDAVPDSIDNCTTIANINQLDTNGDGYGNRCDADLNQSNTVNAADLATFKSRFGTTNADADLDGNGNVNAADLAIFKALFGKAPGPSGLAP